MHKELVDYAKWRIKNSIKFLTEEQKITFIAIHAQTLNLKIEEVVEDLNEEGLNLALAQVTQTIARNKRYGS